MKKEAFTLSEVLIALTVIGVMLHFSAAMLHQEAFICSCMVRFRS